MWILNLFLTYFNLIGYPLCICDTPKPNCVEYYDNKCKTCELGYDLSNFPLLQTRISNARTDASGVRTGNVFLVKTKKKWCWFWNPISVCIFLIWPPTVRSMIRIARSVCSVIIISCFVWQRSRRKLKLLTVVRRKHILRSTGPDARAIGVLSTYLKKRTVISLNYKLYF
jgi:hypothetical protein